jgi:hypothetical protein
MRLFLRQEVRLSHSVRMRVEQVLLARGDFTCMGLPSACAWNKSLSRGCSIIKRLLHYQEALRPRPRGISSSVV